MKELATTTEATLAEQARKHLLRGLPSEQATVLLAVCERYNLDPILKHAVCLAPPRLCPGMRTGYLCPEPPSPVLALAGAGEMGAFTSQDHPHSPDERV